MSEIDGIRERVALDWQTYSSPTIPEMDRRTLLAAYDALAAELASIKAHSKFQADCGRQTSLALIDAGIKSFGFNADGVKELAAERDALRSRLAEAERDGGKWREAALRVGESLIDNGPEGYYQMTPEAWLSWALVALKQADSAPAVDDFGYCKKCGHPRFHCSCKADQPEAGVK